MFIPLLLVFLALVEGKSQWYDRYQQFFTEVLPNNRTLLKIWEEHLRQYNETHSRKRSSFSVPHFDCDLNLGYSLQTPTSVHKLFPGDIKVVAAMGDSLTAGNGILASNILGALLEYRGHAWSIGGDETLDTAPTLPNVLRKYRPNLYGYATGYGKSWAANAGFNVAEPGNEAIDMLNQARALVEKIRNDRNVHMQEDWKVVTLFIGGNDLCGYCDDKQINHTNDKHKGQTSCEYVRGSRRTSEPVIGEIGGSGRSKYSPTNYARHIREALDYLHNNLPRTFVNLVSIFDIAPIASMEKGLTCSVVHSWVCSCGEDPANGAMLRNITHEYQRVTDDLINSRRYDTSDDFTVVVQPFFKRTEPPRLDSNGAIDMSYFSPDCFHFNYKGQYAAAVSLWNNMLEAPSQKQETWHLNQPYHCPVPVTRNPTGYFATYANSK